MFELVIPEHCDDMRLENLEPRILLVAPPIIIVTFVLLFISCVKPPIIMELFELKIQEFVEPKIIEREDAVIPTPCEDIIVDLFDKNMLEFVEEIIEFNG